LEQAGIWNRICLNKAREESMANDDVYATLARISAGDIGLFEKATDDFLKQASRTAKEVVKAEEKSTAKTGVAKA
jgi:hypothetical protein